MWAGSRIDFLRPLEIGSPIWRTSRIADVSGKEGHTGLLIFVRVRHEIRDAGGVVLVNEQDIVYREDPKPGDPVPPFQAASTDAEWTRTTKPDDVLLFRYSALTFNAHRIHYDRRYVTDVEGYPGLVVHGPLIATLLLDLLRRNLPEVRVAHFSFRAVKPTFDVAAFQVCGRRGADGKTVHLWARHNDGALAMDATAILA